MSVAVGLTSTLERVLATLKRSQAECPLSISAKVISSQSCHRDLSSPPSQHPQRHQEKQRGMDQYGLGSCHRVLVSPVPSGDSGTLRNSLGKIRIFLADAQGKVR